MGRQGSTAYNAMGWLDRSFEWFLLARPLDASAYCHVGRWVMARLYRARVRLHNTGPSYAPNEVMDPPSQHPASNVLAAALPE